MPKILILYATTDGHTGKIAIALAATMRKQGCDVQTLNARGADSRLRAADFDGVVVAASVHAGKYQRAARHWVTLNAAGLSGKPGAFISVCLGILENRAESNRNLEESLQNFFDETGWHPVTTRMVAGALPYTRYGFFKKWMMKRIARKAGGGQDTDTSRDYEYTDWRELDSIAREFVGRVQGKLRRVA